MRSSSGVVVLVVVALMMLVVACGLDPTPTPSPSPATPSASPSEVVGSRLPILATASPSSPVGSAGATTADQSLFSIIGGDARELDFRYDPDTTASVAADPGVARDASALAIGLYTIRDQQPVADYGIVSILRLRDRSAGDEWFRAYRDSYDEAACAQAGGVARHAQTTMSDHTVYIGGCAGGAFTYHVRSRDGALVVSITSVGPADLGSRLAADVDQP